MSALLKNLSEYNVSEIPDASEFSFAIVVADYNSDITYPMLRGCIETLLAHGADEQFILVQHVPGAFELPIAAQVLIENNELNAVICLGCVITGETKHDEYISNAVANGLMKLGLDFSIPVIFGVLTPQTQEQAQARAGGKHGNKGVEAAISAIKMAQLLLEE